MRIDFLNISYDFFFMYLTTHTLIDDQRSKLIISKTENTNFFPQFKMVFIKLDYFLKSFRIKKDKKKEKKKKRR